MSERDWAAEKAEEICDAWFGRGAMSQLTKTERRKYVEPIASALRAAAAVPAGCVRDDKGVDHKVESQGMSLGRPILFLAAREGK